MWMSDVDIDCMITQYSSEEERLGSIVATLGGDDYDRGELEEMKHEIESLKKCVAGLLVVLLDRKSVNLIEVTKILSDAQ